MNFLNLNQLPNNLFAEEAVLNILLLNPFLLKNIFSNLKINAFYDLSHKIIYTAMLEVSEKNLTLNLTFLISCLQEQENFEKIGGIEKITRLLNKYENPLDLEDYLKILNEKYFRRILIEFGKEVVQLSLSSSESLEKILEKIDEKLYFLNQQKLFQKTYTAAEIVDEIFTEIKIKITKKEIVGFESCFKDLDSILQGFQKSDLIIIAGRPSMGKTAFALNLGKNIVEKYNVPLIVFTLEMSRQQIIYRFLSNESNISSTRLKSGKMTQLEWKQLSQSMQKISNLNLFIDDNASLTLTEIRASLKKVFQNKKEAGIIIIDYLQLMKTNLKFENRVQEISYLTRNLKIVAKEFEIPIFLLSQLSRGVESRVNKKPVLSDLRESGCVSNKKRAFSSLTWNKESFYTLPIHSGFSLKGKKPSYLITLKNDEQIFLTANHKVLSNKGWLRVSELKQNSKICILSSFKNDEKNIEFCEIKEIKYEQLNLVYDDIIPFFHNFFEKKILIHNSIEQDADIVLMIYREDYYNEKKVYPQTAEIIIAKHRNGSIGSAKLLFNPITTSFYNAKNQT